jgi:hypothetical protein
MVLYFWVIKSRRIRCAGNLPCMGKMINMNKILVRKPERKRLNRRSRCRWEDNINMDLEEGVTMWTRFICFRIGTSGVRTQ